MDPIYDVEVRTLEGQTTTLDEYRGKVLLIVNVASRCGYTPQYEGLESLYQSRGSQGLVVLGFPCNQFGRQEPGTATEIRQFCDTTYRVSFPMFAKVKVNGPDAHPLYQHLTQTKRGALGTTFIKWNFTKFLVDRNGEVVGRFGPRVRPDELRAQVDGLLEVTPGS